MQHTALYTLHYYCSGKKQKLHDENPEINISKSAKNNSSIDPEKKPRRQVRAEEILRGERIAEDVIAEGAPLRSRRDICKMVYDTKLSFFPEYDEALSSKARTLGFMCFQGPGCVDAMPADYDTDCAWCIFFVFLLSLHDPNNPRIAAGMLHCAIS